MALFQSFRPLLGFLVRILALFQLFYDKLVNIYSFTELFQAFKPPFLLGLLPQQPFLLLSASR